MYTYIYISVPRETIGKRRNRHNRQQLITPSRQRTTQTTTPHLHLCGADPPSSWPAQAASHEGDLKKSLRSCHFRTFSGIVSALKHRFCGRCISRPRQYDANPLSASQLPVPR